MFASILISNHVNLYKIFLNLPSQRQFLQNWDTHSFPVAQGAPIPAIQ